jgi:hypothetical protein
MINPVKILERKIRENIAQEIEQLCGEGRCTNYEGTWICSHYADAIIIRENK